MATECPSTLHHLTQFKQELFLEAVGNYYKIVSVTRLQVEKIYDKKQETK